MTQKPLVIFISYSHKDEEHRCDLLEHLAPLRRQGLIDAWYDRKITPGDNGDKEIDAQLERADIVLLLVSASFVDSLYCWEKELTRALERHEAGQTVFIPIIVRAVHLQGVPFERIQSLPTDRKPVTSWLDRDEAWKDVVSGICEAAQKINRRRQRLQERHDVRTVQNIVQRLEPIVSILSKTVDQIDELYRKQGTVTGIPTGFTDLDEQTSGLLPSDLIVIAGRPGMGKTAFALNMAENAAVGHKLPVAIFSMEMQSSQVAIRMLASLGRINAHRLRTGKLDDEDWPRLTAAVSLLAEAPVFIDDTAASSLTELRARAMRIRNEHGLALVVVDYLQLLQVGGGEEIAGRAHDMAIVSHGLKALARELDVPVIALS